MIEAVKREPYRVEIINGRKVVAMAPAFSNHNAVKLNVATIFKIYLKGNVCIPIPDGEKLVLVDGEYVIPDFFVICDRSKYKKDGVHGVPELIVEVLSPKTKKYDCGEKKDLYQQSGVGEYWIIDPDARTIEIYLLENGLYKLDNVYRVPDELEDVEDKDVEPTEFRVHTFPDLTVRLEDVFEYVNLWDES